MFSRSLFRNLTFSHSTLNWWIDGCDRTLEVCLLCKLGMIEFFKSALSSNLGVMEFLKSACYKAMYDGIPEVHLLCKLSVMEFLKSGF